jgi:hypothetical protein
LRWHSPGAHTFQCEEELLSDSEDWEMYVTQYVGGSRRQDVALVKEPSGVDLVIEALDEFAPASTGQVSGLCLCATNADYVYGATARN